MSDKSRKSRPQLRICPETLTGAPSGALSAPVGSSREQLEATRAKVAALLAEHRERRRGEVPGRVASRSARLGRQLDRLRGAKERPALRHQVEIDTPSPDTGRPINCDAVGDILAIAAKTRVLIRLRGRRLHLERHGDRIPPAVLKRVQVGAFAIAVLLAGTPCSRCEKPSGRIEPAPGRRPSRPWRIVCTSCGRRLRLRR